MSAERDERMHRWRKVNRKARIKIGNNRDLGARYRTDVIEAMYTTERAGR